LGAVADLGIDSWALCGVPRCESICFWRRLILQEKHAVRLHNQPRVAPLAEMSTD